MKKAQQQGYKVILLYFWLDDVQQAVNRVAQRVLEGGHNIPKEIIERRYAAGIRNLFEIYFEICDGVLVYDNTDGVPKSILERKENTTEIIDLERFDKMKAL